MSLDKIEQEINYLKREIYPYFTSCLALLRRKKTNQLSQKNQISFDLPNLDALISELSEDQNLIQQLEERHKLSQISCSNSLNLLIKAKESLEAKLKASTVQQKHVESSCLMLQEDYFSSLARYIELGHSINKTTNSINSLKKKIKKAVHEKNKEKQNIENSMMERLDLESSLREKIKSLEKKSLVLQKVETSHETKASKLSQEISIENCKIGEQEILKKQYEKEISQLNEQISNKNSENGTAKKEYSDVFLLNEKTSRFLFELSIQFAIDKESFEKVLKQKSDQRDYISVQEKKIGNLKSEINTLLTDKKKFNLNKVWIHRSSRAFSQFKFAVKISTIKYDIKKLASEELSDFSRQIDAENSKELEDFKAICIDQNENPPNKKRGRKQKPKKKGSEQVAVATENLVQRKKKSSEPSLAGLFSTITSIKNLPKDSSLSYASKKKSSSIFEDLSDSFFH
ncbi:unnamed protein product [Blepharisma stoltei]|uniref:Uncharacterized protein n=1 Tax=Blepharisma stoltei TaxID=1481888 RepID=A0AAU9J6E8_9CILI|nr:unnamed protein product [Blepharisma stoltei]